MSETEHNKKAACECAVCQRTRRLDAIRGKLSEDDAQCLIDIEEQLIYAEEDAAYYQAKYEGTWPSPDGRLPIAARTILALSRRVCELQEQNVSAKLYDLALREADEYRDGNLFDTFKRIIDERDTLRADCALQTPCSECFHDLEFEKKVTAENPTCPISNTPCSRFIYDSPGYWRNEFNKQVRLAQQEWESMRASQADLARTVQARCAEVADTFSSVHSNPSLKGCSHDIAERILALDVTALAGGEGEHK